MIKVHLFNWDCGTLDIEKELGISDDIIDFLEQNVSGLHFEASDNEGDMENNTILWFAADDEENCSDEIRNVLSSLISSNSNVKYTVSIVDDLS